MIIVKKNSVQKIIFNITLSLLIFSCLDPYDTNIKGYENLLVVDALITDENRSHYVLLSRTIPDLNQEPQRVANAWVSITDENFNETILRETSPGIYATDSTKFRAQVGKTYTLKISTPEGKTYISNPCTMLPSGNIEKIYYNKDKGWNNDNTYESEGISVYIDGSAQESEYARWSFEEDWKFQVFCAPDFSFDTDGNIVHINNDKIYCWKSALSTDITLHSFKNHGNNTINKKKIHFIPTSKTDRISLRYSILVKQLSISKEEYEFWDKLQKSTEDVGDILGKQPFSIAGNMNNIDDKTEPVLGYFQVSSTSQKRLYIENSDLSKLDVPFYSHKSCKIDTVLIDNNRYTSIYDIYLQEVATGRYGMYDVYYPEMSMTPTGLLLTQPTCCDCTLTGTNKKPDFWQD
ncbi:MAG: DUF4249 domain-containing protein [Marinilabiliaceae bacterium]|nr:DUF4249 domain-containing protein [Marinilabiliaceae bacterium]